MKKEDVYLKLLVNRQKKYNFICPFINPLNLFSLKFLNLITKKILINNILYTIKFIFKFFNIKT